MFRLFGEIIQCENCKVTFILEIKSMQYFFKKFICYTHKYDWFIQKVGKSKYVRIFARPCPVRV